MRPIATILRAMADPNPPPTCQTCHACSHFCSDPALIEAELPGLATLSSGYASVRAKDGLCKLHDRLVNGLRRCDGFA